MTTRICASINWFISKEIGENLYNIKFHDIREVLDITLLTSQATPRLWRLR